MTEATPPEHASAEHAYGFELFGERHRPLRAAFSCARTELEDYLKTRARKEMDHNIAVVYVLRDALEDRIAGFYTISALSVEFPEGVKKGLPKYPEYPATLLGRLAVDDAYRGRGLGRRILLDALGRSLAGSRAVASHAVIVDAIDEGAEAFYARYGFVELALESGERSTERRKRMFLPMRTIEKLFAGAGPPTKTGHQ